MIKNTICACMAAAVLSACGGSAGDSVFDTSTATTYNVSAADHNLLTTAGAWNTTGSVTVSNVTTTFSFALSLNPLAAGVFALTGASASRNQESLVLTSTGASPATVTATQYFNPTSNALLGSVDASGNCTRVDSNGTLPTSATIGTSGAWYASSDLATCSSGASVTMTDTVTWSLEQDGSVVLVCQNDTSANAAGSGLAGTVSICIQTAADGTLGSKARISIALPSQSFTVVTRNY